MAKMNDQVPSRLNDIFLKIDLYDPTSKFQELEIGSDLTFMQSRFFTNLKNVKLSKQAQNLSYRFLQILALNEIHHYKSTVKFSTWN